MISFEIGQGRFNYRVAGICIHDGYVLLQRSVADDFWFLPGGRVDMMETSAEALKREMREELKLDGDIEVVRLLWVNENLFFDENENTSYHEVGFYYEMNFDAFPALYDTSHPLIGIEDTGLYADQPASFVLRWLPLDALDDATVYPPFLKAGLRNLPASMQHIALR